MENSFYVKAAGAPSRLFVFFDMQPVEFRASIIAPITWTLIILFLGWPMLGGVLVIIGLFLGQTDIAFIVALVLGAISMTLIWPYNLTLRVTLGA